MVRCTGRGCCVRVAPCAHHFPARATARRRARASGSPQTRWMRGPLFSRARRCARARPRRRHLGPSWAILGHLGPSWATLGHLGPPWAGVGRNRPPEIILPVVASGRAGARLLSWTRPFRCAELSIARSRPFGRGRLLIARSRPFGRERHLSHLSRLIPAYLAILGVVPSHRAGETVREAGARLLIARSRPSGRGRLSIARSRPSGRERPSSGRSRRSAC